MGNIGCTGAGPMIHYSLPSNYSAHDKSHIFQYNTIEDNTAVYGSGTYISYWSDTSEVCDDCCVYGNVHNFSHNVIRNNRASGVGAAIMIYYQALNASSNYQYFYNETISNNVMEGTFGSEKFGSNGWAVLILSVQDIPLGLNNTTAKLRNWKYLAHLFSEEKT
jgi:hypothetical protein